ncbi:MAG: recombinase zinc beta ribbon domain-containing protein [Firmicutes bacterium]|nr:recombinase zinc beta ribbon domain-containing protein [Bacillota bacterium]
MEKAIQVKGLQKFYKQLHVLKGVDFEVEKGSIFTLLGSNGAGKTTIVKILTTLLKTPYRRFLGYEKGPDGLPRIVEKTKVNEGEVPQYYVENSHPAIIEPEVFDLVQSEIKKRKARRPHQSGIGCFSGKIICGECGGLYGSKVWHSNSKYRRAVWQCNNKFKNGTYCQTPHLSEETLKKRSSRRSTGLWKIRTGSLKITTPSSRCLRIPPSWTRKASDCGMNARSSWSLSANAWMKTPIPRWIRANIKSGITGWSHGMRPPRNGWTQSRTISRRAWPSAKTYRGSLTICGSGTASLRF